MFEFEMTHEPAFMYSKKLWKSPENSMINSTFEVYRQLYSQKFFGENFIVRQKVKEVIEGLIWCLQILSLLWVPNLPIKDWSENKIIWEILGYLRFDIVCSEFGMINICLFFSAIMVFLIFFGMMLLVYTTYNSYNTPKWLLFIFKKIIYLWINIFLVPSMSIFTIFLKYSFFDKKHISEYRENNDFSDFQINFFLQILIISSMIISFFEVLFYANFSGEIRHSMANKTIKSKAHSKIDIQILFFTWISPIFWALFAEDYIIYFQIFIMIFSTLLMIESMMILPYFSLYCNSLQILRLSLISLASFAFIFGYALDNSLVISFLVIILGIISGKLILTFSKKLHLRINEKIPENLAKINSECNLEKSLRFALCSNDIENRDQIIFIFESFYKENYNYRSKLQLIWLANYCIFTLNDESLAKIKLSNSKHFSDWSLEGKYQEYLCNKNISEAISSECEKFIIYLQKLNQVKKEDKKLCMNLLRFWEEMTSTKPNLYKIIKELNSIHSEISFLKLAYHQLTTKFPLSRETLSLYSSYAKNILFDLQKSIVLDAKLRNFDRIVENSSNDLSNFSYFNRASGVLIISCENVNFGQILFANQKSSEILQTYNILGENISQFIPANYCEKIKEETKWISGFSSSSLIDLTEGFFMMAPSHILLECAGKVQITTINNILVATLSFKLKSTTHQVALISEDLEIYCHTLNFPKLCNKSDSDLRGLFLKKIFSNLEGLDLHPFIPYQILPSTSETILVLSFIEFYTFKMHYALLINDKTEIIKWKGENFDLSNNNIEDEINRNHRRESKLLKSVEIKSIENQQPERIFDSKMELQSNEQLLSNALGAIDSHISAKTDEEKSQKSESSSQNKFLKLIQISSRSINILHVAFIISILAVIATNIGVLFYANYSIKISSNMDASITLGKAAKIIENVGFLSEDIYLMASANDPSNNDVLELLFSGFITAIESLDSLYLNITADLNSWNYCSVHSIFIDENINLWITDNGIYMKKSNLLNTISMFSRIGQKYANKFNNSQNYTEELLFLVFNGYGEAFKYCNQSMYNIIACQNDIMNTFESEMLAFMILGIIVFFICVCCMIPFCYSSIKIENNLWNNLRNMTYECYAELRQLSFERLGNIYGNQEIELNHRNPSKKIYNFNSYWKYFWRISIYFFIVSLFSVVNIIYLYEKCAEYLYKRPEIIRDLIHGQILFTTLGVWTTRSLSDNYGLSFLIADSLIPLKRSETEWQEIIKKINYLKMHIRNNDYSSVISNKFTYEFYENAYESTSIKLAFGVYPAENILIIDAYYLVYSFSTIELWLDWVINISYIVDKYDELTNEIDNYSQKLINDKLNIIVIALAIFIATSFVMYFGLYFTFFRNEKKYLRKINSMIKIIPQ